MRRLSLLSVLLACTPEREPEPRAEIEVAPPARPPTDPPAPLPVPAPRTSEFEGALSCVGSFDDTDTGVVCELLRTRAAELDAQELLKEARVVIARRGDAQIGVHLFGIRRDRLLASIGLRNGDLIERIGGRALDTEAVTLDLIEHPPTPPVVIEFSRQGKPRRLTLEVVDSLSGPPRTLVDDASPSAEPLAPPPGPSCLPDEDTCELDAKQLEALLASGVALPRFVPTTRGGVAIGIKIYAVRPGSGAAQLGLRNGDLLMKVDGVMPTGDVDPLAEPLARLAAGDIEQVEVELERRGGPLVRRFVKAPAAAG